MKATTEAAGSEAKAPPRWEKAFLASLSTLGVVAAACEATGVSRSTVYEHRATHRDFAEQWRQAVEDAADRAETEAIRRAIEGDREPVLYRGKPVWIHVDEQGELVPEGTPGATLKPLLRTTRSDLLLIFTLKALRPEKFRDRYDVHHSSDEAEIDREIKELIAGLEASVRQGRPTKT